jgi:hypothetical protein
MTAGRNAQPARVSLRQLTVSSLADVLMLIMVSMQLHAPAS